MINAIEGTKRNMFKALEDLKGRIGINYSIKDMLRGVDELENSLEEHLEELRKAMVTINESTVRCAQHSAGAFLDLETRLARMTEERDSIRNKLQAFEFANRSAAELLSDALREPSGLRKSEGGTSHQNNEESRLCATCGGFGKVLCMHSFFAIGDDPMKCTFCGVVK